MAKSKLKICNIVRTVSKYGFVFYFETISNKKIYSQRIEVSEGKVIKWSCNCKWGTIGRFNKKYILKDKKCKHVSKCISLLKDFNYIKNEKEKTNEKNKEKEKKVSCMQ